MKTSRIPGFYNLTIAERRRLLASKTSLTEEELAALDSGGLDRTTCDRMIENVVGRYNLPFAVALNFRVNDQDVFVPMVIEEPSVVAAASNAARMVQASGGFHATVSPPIMIGQVQLLDVPNPQKACEVVQSRQEEILAAARKQVPSLVKRGGGPTGLNCRVLSLPTEPDGGMVVVHLHIDVRDAMGANLVNTVVEGIAPQLAEMTGSTVGLRILSNLAIHRTVHVRAHIADRDFGEDGKAVRERIVAASRFAELDPFRATTHNKGIMNGVDAVLMATANDWRSAEAGAHAFAAQSGHYRPLAVWRTSGDGLDGEMTLPMAVGTVGGALQVHDGAQLALRILGTRRAADLAAVAAAAGLATNLAALRALANEGIQQGHMALHRRIVSHAATKESRAGEQNLGRDQTDRSAS